MSEQGPQFDPNIKFPIMVDPVVQRSLEQAKQFQEELDSSPSVPLERVKEMLQELDSGWMHYNERVFVSGHVRSPIVHVEETTSENGEPQSNVTTYVDRDNDRQEMQEYFSNEVEFTSKGFLIDDEPYMIGGYEIGRHYMLRLLLSRTVYVYVPEKQTPRPFELHTLASPDDVVMEFTHDSFEYNELKSREYFPDFMAKLDEKIDGATRIADKITALSGLEIELNDHITDIEVLVLEAYLDELVNPLEEDLPFLALLHKDAVYFDPDDKTDVWECHEEETLQMISICGIRTVIKTDVAITSDQIITTTQPNTLELRLAGQIRAEDAEDDSMVVEIRLRDIKSLANVRQSVFESEEVEDD